MDMTQTGIFISTLVCGNRDGGNHADGVDKRGCDADFCCVSGENTWGTKTVNSLRPATESGVEGSDSTTNGDGTSTNASGGASSPMLSGERTFQEIIGEICEGIDLMFICKRNTVVVTDIETLYTEADFLRRNNKAQSEDVKLWQLEDGSYELDINQYGMYNTVKVIYKNGVAVESYPDLVRVYGQVIDTHVHKNLNKTQAQQKAKAYLAAHLRDFNMTISASILHDGAIDIGDMVTIENPLTLNNEIKKQEEETPIYYFVNGLSIDWDEGPIKCDLELTYAPESPEKPEIPEVGAGYMNVQQATDGVETEGTEGDEAENQTEEGSL